MQTIHFDDKVVVESTNTGKTIDADVLSFKENRPKIKIHGHVHV